MATKKVTKKVTKKSAPAKATKAAEKPAKKAPAPKSKPGAEKPTKKKAPGAAGDGDARALFKSAVKGLDKKWKAATAGMGFEDDVVQTGDYVMKLASAKVGVWPSDNTPYFRLRWVIANGDSQGKKVSTTDNLLNKEGEPNEVALSIIKGNLDKLGYDVEDLELADLADVADQLNEEKPAARCHVKATKGSQGDRTFYSVYVNRLIESDDPEESEEYEDEDEDEDEDEE